MINAKGEIFRIDSPQGEPMESENSRRRLNTFNWEPVTKPLPRFTQFKELMELASVGEGKQFPLPESAICDLHSGPRGLVAMTGEWCDRLKTILSTAEQLREVNYDDPNLPDLLEQISIEALAMRALL
jgi:hypothetical protein